MARFAPVYMSVYDGPDLTLVDLELSASTFADDAAEDTVIGTLSGMGDENSVLSVTTGAGKVKIDGDDLVVGPDASTAGTLNITVRETNIYGYNNPHDTNFAITVTGE